MRGGSRESCGVARERPLVVTLQKVTRNKGTRPKPEAELGWAGCSLPRWPYLFLFPLAWLPEHQRRADGSHGAAPFLRWH